MFCCSIYLVTIYLTMRDNLHNEYRNQHTCWTPTWTLSVSLAPSLSTFFPFANILRKGSLKKFCKTPFTFLTYDKNVVDGFVSIFSVAPVASACSLFEGTHFRLWITVTCESREFRNFDVLHVMTSWDISSIKKRVDTGHQLVTPE